MSKKLLTLFIPIAALLGVAAGNVYAFYAVNDNADPQGALIKVDQSSSPKTVSYYIPNINGDFFISGDPVEVGDTSFNVAENAPITNRIQDYKFVGWCYDEELTQDVDSTINIKKDTNLYAKYVGYFVSLTEFNNPTYYIQLSLDYDEESFIYEDSYSGYTIQVYKKYLSAKSSSYLTDTSLNNSGIYLYHSDLFTATGRYKINVKADGTSWDIKRVVCLKFNSTAYWKAESVEKYAVYSWYASGDENANSWSDIVVSNNSAGTETFYVEPKFHALKFVRLNNTATEPSWDSKWNESGNVWLDWRQYSSEKFTQVCTEWDNWEAEFIA